METIKLNYSLFLLMFIVVSVTSYAIFINTETGACTSYRTCTLQYMCFGAFASFVVVGLSLLHEPIKKLIKSKKV